MPRLTVLALFVAALAAAAPATAQNAGQIARVQAGRSCVGCNLFQGDFSGLEASGLNLSRSRLRQADLSLAVLNRASFAGADLRDVDAYGAVFGGASFSGANLTNASFVGVHLEGANFAGATASRSTLTEIFVSFVWRAMMARRGASASCRVISVQPRVFGL